MTGDCQRVRESLAAGESSERIHLEGCPGCAAFAVDLERLREAAAGLPRPPLPASPRARAAVTPVGRRALFALATAASIALAFGLVLRDHAHRVPPPLALDARAPAAGTEEQLDLLASLADARRVYAPSASGAPGWLSLPRAEVGRAIEIDPLASLQAAALLIEDNVSNPRRKK